MKDEMFKKLDVEKFWYPFVQTLLDAHNTLMIMTNNDDEAYAKGMMAVKTLLEPFYGKWLDKQLYDRTFYVFIYVIETVYGNPYSKEKKMYHKYATTSDLFNNIKKHWNDNIEKELKKYEV